MITTPRSLSTDLDLFTFVENPAVALVGITLEVDENFFNPLARLIPEAVALPEPTSLVLLATAMAVRARRGLSRKRTWVGR